MSDFKMGKPLSIWPFLAALSVALWIWPSAKERDDVRPSPDATLFSDSVSVDRGPASLDSAPPRVERGTVRTANAPLYAVVGTAEGFAGGDPREEALLSVRERFADAVRAMGDRTAAFGHGLCSAQRCGAGSDPVLCERLQRTSAEQQLYCDRFLKARGPELLAQNEAKRTPARFSSVPLQQLGSDGRSRSVAALTNPDPLGAVIIHAETFQGLSPDLRLALWAHEVGHKTAGLGATAAAAKPVGPFSDAEAFLDTIGAAVALYAARTPASSPLSAYPLTEGESRQGCRLVSSPRDGELVGALFDLEGVPPSRPRLDDFRRELDSALATAPLDEAWGRATARMARSRSVGSQFIRALYERFLRRAPSQAESRELEHHLQTGDAWDTLVAGILGGLEYQRYRRLENEAQFVSEIWRELTGGIPTSAEITVHVDRVQRLGRAQWVLGVLKKERAIHDALVSGWFRHFLHRQPASRERARFLALLESGRDWVSLQATILSTNEYRVLQRNRWSACLSTKSDARF